MSYRLVEMVLESSLTDPIETAVMIALASHADKYCSCYPSVARIAKLSRYKERSIQKALRSLTERGFITVKVGGGRGGASFYTIHPAALKPAPDAPAPSEIPAQHAPFREAKPRTTCTVSKSETPHHMRHPPAPHAPPPAPHAPEPVIEQVKKKEAEEEGARGKVADLTLIPRLTHALGFDLHGIVPKYWVNPDAALIVARWQTDLGLTPDEILQVAVGNMRAHGAAAQGPKTLTRHMQDYAAAKNAPPLEPSKGSPHVQDHPRRNSAPSDQQFTGLAGAAMRRRAAREQGHGS